MDLYLYPKMCSIQVELVNYTTIYPTFQPMFLVDIIYAFLSSSFSSLTFNHQILLVLLPRYTSYLLLFIALLPCSCPSHYHLLCGFSFQIPKCVLCYLFFFLPLPVHFPHSSYKDKGKVHTISLWFNIIDCFQTPHLVPLCLISSHLVAHLLFVLQSHWLPFSSWNTPSSSVLKLFSLCYLSAQNALYLLLCIGESLFLYIPIGASLSVTSEIYSLILSTIFFKGCNIFVIGLFI